MSDDLTTEMMVALGWVPQGKEFIRAGVWITYDQATRLCIADALEGRKLPQRRVTEHRRCG